MMRLECLRKLQGLRMLRSLFWQGRRRCRTSTDLELFQLVRHFWASLGRYFRLPSTQSVGTGGGFGISSRASRSLDKAGRLTFRDELGRMGGVRRVRVSDAIS